MSTTHLSLKERHYIEIALGQGTSQNEIAQTLHRSQGSISKEIHRNTGKKGYRHNQAHRIAGERHKNKAKNSKMTDKVIHLIKKELCTHQSSPEQIAEILQLKNEISIHHETIYRYILQDKKAGGLLYLNLRHQSKPYRKRYGSTTNSSYGIPHRTDIDERPDVANNRKRLGDWEADTMSGKNQEGAMLTIDERVSKIRLALPLRGKFAEDTKDGIIELLKPFKDVVKSITFDNGREFVRHEEMAKTLDCDTYFAKPYHAWERGQNENANGLLRQYFPKDKVLVDITRQSVFDAVDRLNSRPRKCLGFKTPYEAFEKLSGFNAKILLRGIPL